MYVCIYACMYICMHIYTYVCICVCMYVLYTMHTMKWLTSMTSNLSVHSYCLMISRWWHAFSNQCVWYSLYMLIIPNYCSQAQSKNRPLDTTQLCLQHPCLHPHTLTHKCRLINLGSDQGLSWCTTRPSTLPNVCCSCKLYLPALILYILCTLK